MLSNYLEKTYGGFLGMSVGVRLGAPVEPPVWTDNLIKKVYGNINSYIKDYKNFAADDDTNGPIFFIRSLIDDAIDRELEPQDVGKAWLNYAREGIGMFWWGGEGVSTEHTAYLNLLRGMDAPKSGSTEVNGLITSEQIGGQIFIDSWGLLFPGEPTKAANYAAKAASVSHDGNGIYGAKFIAACISQAYETSDINEIIDKGLNEIPSDSTYARMISDVRKFHRNNPDSFRECRQYLEEEWGYDKYAGVCHIIPNAAVCVLSLLYGEGEFSKTIEIATMCGWDTDCNAGNVGTIVGVMNGIQEIPNHYREPINDVIIASSVSGYLNIVDIPTFIYQLAELKYKLANESIPKEISHALQKGNIHFNFNLPGSTQGFRADKMLKTDVRHSKEGGKNNTGALEILVDRLLNGDRGYIYYKPFYRREDFDDERYQPVFSPTVTSGQIMSLDVYMDKWFGKELLLTPYIRLTEDKSEIFGESTSLVNHKWQDISFTIPDSKGSIIDEVGFVLESPSPREDRAFGCLYLDKFEIKGKSAYTIDMAKQSKEFSSITPFSHNHGMWTLEDSKMRMQTKDDAFAFTGNYYAANYKVGFMIKPIHGLSHTVLFRGKGIKRQYLVGFDGENRVALIENDFNYKRLKTVKYNWEANKEYHFLIECDGNSLCLFINGEKVLEGEIKKFDYGMFGYGAIDPGESLIYNFSFEEL